MLTTQALCGRSNARLIKHKLTLKTSTKLHLLSAVATYRTRTYATAVEDKREKVVILGSGWAGE
jgi:hypothetical protein